MVNKNNPKTAKTQIQQVFQHSQFTDLVVNTALWNIIQTVFPQVISTAPPETPQAEQQQQSARPRANSTSTLPSNSRLGRPATDTRSFIPPRAVTTTTTRATQLPPAINQTVTSTPSSSPPVSRQGDSQEQIDQLTEALGGLEVIDLTQEEDNGNTNENSEPIVETAHAAVARIHPQRRLVLAPSRSSNTIVVSSNVDTAVARPRKVVSGLFYRSAPSQN